VATPSGFVLTRDAPPDHPWHHGLWFAIKYVNGDNFWEEHGAYGVIRHVDDVRLEWIAPDRESVVMDEDRHIDSVDLADDAYAIDIVIRLTPRVDVVLDRTPFTTWGGYSGLTLRGSDAWTDTRLMLDDGSVHERVLGTRSAWCDISSGAGGMVIVPHQPTPWYGSTRADTYGDGWANFLNAAFLWDGPMEVAAGTTVPFDYRVVVHDGIWTKERCRGVV
jgi:hypothetical protein